MQGRKEQVNTSGTDRGIGGLGGRLLPYLLWVVSIVLAGADFPYTHSAIQLLAAIFTPYVPTETVRMRYQVHTISLFSIVILGMIWLVAAIFLLHYYEEGNRRGRLWRRFLGVTIVEAVIFAVGMLLPSILVLLF